MGGGVGAGMRQPGVAAKTLFALTNVVLSSLDKSQDPLAWVTARTETAVLILPLLSFKFKKDSLVTQLSLKRSGSSAGVAKAVAATAIKRAAPRPENDGNGSRGGTLTGRAFCVVTGPNVWLNTSIGGSWLETGAMATRSG